jgi:cytochrome c551/c552
VRPLALGGALLLAAVGAGCSEPGPTGPAAIYVDQGCAKCHGEQFEGKRTAPPLTNLASQWSGEDLATYLRDPTPFLEGSTRLRTQAERYPIPMPAYPDLSDEDVAALVAYLLESTAPE